MRRWPFAVGAFAAGLVAFGLLVALPFLRSKQQFPASITSPAPHFAVGLATLKPRSRLCMTEITIEPRSQLARFQVGTFKRRGSPLELTMRGLDYSFRTRLPGGYPDNQMFELPVRSPQRPTLLRVCVRNLGRHKVALYSEPILERSRSDVEIDGRPQSVTPQFGFWERGRRPLASHAGLTVERMTRFRGPFAHVWLIWLVLGLATLALTAGMAVVLWRGFSADGSAG